MNLLTLKIDILKSILYKEIETNGYSFNHNILVLSQILDEFIVEYERETKEVESQTKRVSGGML